MAASSRSGYGSSRNDVVCVCIIMLMLFVSIALYVPESEGRKKYHLRGDHMKPAYDVEMVGITKDQAMITSVDGARRLTEETMQLEGREDLAMTNDYASGCVASANTKDDPTPIPCP